MLHLWNNAVSFKGFFNQTIYKKKKQQQTLTRFAGSKTFSDAYFWADSWMKIESLPYWPPNDNYFTIPLMPSVRMKNFQGILFTIPLMPSVRMKNFQGILFN